MARMHTRRKGKSRSTKPLDKKVKQWIRYNSDEVQKLVLKLRKKGLSSSEIGLKLRDQYGIPDVKTITDKKITKILEENNEAPEIPEDLMNLLEKYVSVVDHYESNKQDITAKRGIRSTESKIKRLVRYYKKKGKIDKDFKLTYKAAKRLTA